MEFYGFDILNIIKCGTRKTKLRSTFSYDFIGISYLQRQESITIKNIKGHFLILLRNLVNKIICNSIKQRM